jgi:hypothetical protein
MATGYTQMQIRRLKWKSRLNIFARVHNERGCGRVTAWTTPKRYHPIVLLAPVATAWVFFYSLDAQELKASPPKLDLILDSLERTEEQNPALSRPYEVTRQYKVFRAGDPKPVSEITAQIGFTPPDIKTFKITEEEGNPRGKKIVNAILEQEIASAKAGHKGAISRSNYDFAFLREQNFGAVPEYVLHIIPKRKEKGLLFGEIWVDAQTYHIRQIVGAPLKSPSFWINDLHITVQFAAVNGMWIPVSVDAIATIRFLGIYTLSGRDLAPPVAASSRQNFSDSLLSKRRRASVVTALDDFAEVSHGSANPIDGDLHCSGVRP